MRLLCFIFALFFLVSCGDDESAVKTDPSHEIPDASSGPQLGWMIMPSPSARDFNPNSAAATGALSSAAGALSSAAGALSSAGGANGSPGGAVYYAPSYAPPYSNAPASYRAPALVPFNRTLASGAHYYTITGGVLGGVPGGVIAGFPSYGGVPAGGALPGGLVGAGSNLGATTLGSGRFSPPAPGRTIVVRWPRYWTGYSYVNHPVSYGPSGYIAVPVSVTPNSRGPHATYRPRAVSSDEPHPVIVYVPTAAGFYQPIVTFRGTM